MSFSIIHEKILITVKTYPTLSNTYGELVCTAGLREDGSWIRLYPIPFRLQRKETQYKKFQWVYLDVYKRKSNFDARKESYSPANIDEINLGDFLEPENPLRSEIVHRSKIYELLSDLTDGEKKDRVSLATFRPTRVKRMIATPCERDWDPEKKALALQGLRQRTLFDTDSEREFKKFFTPAKKIPFHFKYVFEDAAGRESTLTVEDWELGALFLNCRESYGEEIAVKKTIEKYESFISNPDLLFFLGTTKKFHYMAPNPFMIVGVYRQSPKMKLSKEQKQTRSLFDILPPEENAI